MPGQGQQAFRGFLGFARRSQHQREQGRRKGVENGASSRSIAGGLHSHQPDQTGKLVGGGPDALFVMAVS